MARRNRSAMGATTRTPMTHGPTCACRLCVGLDDRDARIAGLERDLGHATRRLADAEKKVDALTQDRNALMRTLDIFFGSITRRAT